MVQVVLVFTWLTCMPLLAINVAVKKVLFTTVVGMVITAMEHLLCKAALGQKLNCTTVGIIQWTWDCVAQTLLWNVKRVINLHYVVVALVHVYI